MTLTTLGLSQRDVDRITSLLGRAPATDGAAHSGGNGDDPENPRRLVRKSFYAALGLALTAMFLWTAKQAGSAALAGAKAEVELHHTVGDHTRTLAVHEEEIRGLRAQLVPSATAARLVELLEQEQRVRESKSGTRRQR